MRQGWRGRSKRSFCRLGVSSALEPPAKNVGPIGTEVNAPERDSECARGHGRLGALPVDEPSSSAAATPPKKKLTASAAWREANELMWARRGRLALGLAIMLVNRLSGLVLPATSKYLIDDVIGKERADC